MLASKRSKVQIRVLSDIIISCLKPKYIDIYVLVLVWGCFLTFWKPLSTISSLCLHNVIEKFVGYVTMYMYIDLSVHGSIGIFLVAL